jgi:hypothetical protein
MWNETTLDMQVACTDIDVNDVSYHYPFFSGSSLLPRLLLTVIARDHSPFLVAACTS